jgi:ribosomal protein S4E
LGTQARDVPYATTHDGRTVRYPDPKIKKNDVLKIDLATGKVTSRIKKVFRIEIRFQGSEIRRG